MSESVLLGLLKIYYSICITNSNYIVPVTHQWMCSQIKNHHFLRIEGSFVAERMQKFTGGLLTAVNHFPGSLPTGISVPRARDRGAAAPTAWGSPPLREASGPHLPLGGGGGFFPNPNEGLAEGHPLRARLSPWRGRCRRGAGALLQTGASPSVKFQGTGFCAGLVEEGQPMRMARKVPAPEG